MKFYIPPPGASWFLPLTGSTQAEFPSFSPEKEKLRAEGDLSSQLWARINFPGTTGLYWNSGLDSPLHPLRSLEAGGGGEAGRTERGRKKERARLPWVLCPPILAHPLGSTLAALREKLSTPSEAERLELYRGISSGA